MQNYLKKIRKQRNMTQQEVADLLGIQQQSYARIESAEITSISPERLLKLSDIFGVTLNTILGTQETVEKGFKIPVVGTIPAGVPIEAIEEILDYEEIPLKMASNGEFFGLKVQGDSMCPRIENGDVVIVRKQNDAESGDVCVVMVNGFDATLKQIKKDNNGMTLIPFNKNYKQMFYSIRDIEELPVKIIGVVVELRGKFKNI